MRCCPVTPFRALILSVNLSVPRELQGQTPEIGARNEVTRVFFRNGIQVVSVPPVTDSSRPTETSKLVPSFMFRGNCGNLFFIPI